MNNNLIKKNRARVARMLLIIWMLNMIQPFGAFALTSGPSQPEVQTFQQAGVSDMVDVFNGDFKYNIPLLEVDGYPINLNYQSGVSMDDEATWVGLGWNLNVGSISRQLRGIPDDFAGDEFKTEHHTKPKITTGGRLTGKVELFGKNKLKFGGSLTFGVFSDNYTGMGAEVGVNAGMSYSLSNDRSMTAGLGIGVLSSTSGGLDITPNISLSISEETKDKIMRSSGMSSSLGYNSRAGMMTYNFGSTGGYFSTSLPSISFNTEPINPKVQIPYFSSYQSFSVDAGPTAVGVFGGVGGTGYQNVRSVANELLTNPAYGFLYADLGKNKLNAVMDFIREKENPIIKELPNLALPIHTPDIFSFNSQSGSGQFRLFRGGTGAFFDNEVSDKSKVLSIGFDLGFGSVFHGGSTLFNQTTTNVTRKWTRDNIYLKKGDFQDEPKIDPRKQHVFFRKTDEKNIEDLSMANKLQNSSLLAISTSRKTADSSFITQNGFGSNIITPVITAIEKESRQVQSTVISYLTAEEAAKAGLGLKTNNYNFNVYNAFQVPFNHKPISTEENRVDAIRKKHHISEITVNNTDGQRAVYGLPVYNLAHEEYSFAVGTGYESKNGLVAIADSGIERNKGIDHYYHKESQSPYAYSYLLTGILSPDYIDKTNNGVSEDDIGTGIRFNYSKVSNYKWRTPYKTKLSDAVGAVVRNTASLNRGLLADPSDDKASIIYGRKDICYVSSIESKTKIAYFITEDRDDALGVQDLNGAPDLSIRQKRLKEIRLYSKGNMTKPIKVVKFQYDYELCPGTPNSVAEVFPGATIGKGKLTLRKVWFEYGLTHKGINHPYVFNYNNQVAATTVNYTTMHTDRWGSYKFPSQNPGNLSNEEYPYATQDKVYADNAAKLWHIQSIELPSGGKIEVNYEADDYAYVQNKRAMEMVPIQTFGSASGPASLAGANGVSLHVDLLPVQGEDATTWFKNTYLNGSDYLYTKSYVKISTPNCPSEGKDWDFVPVYCKVKTVALTGQTANIEFEKISESDVDVNPILIAAWQRLKNEYPRYAYPGFQNRVGDNATGVETAVIAIMTAARNLSEFVENFYEKANRKGYATTIDPAKSFARIVKTSGFKIGGGVRIKTIKIDDSWNGLSGQSAPSGVYGQSYDYTVLENGRKISSGVATYEPSVGNDENALKQPVPYVQKIKGAINNFFELEEPFGESLYPSPSVGYSKVTVRDLQGGEIQMSASKTGDVVNEFYTAKDFPVLVSFSQLKPYNPKPSHNYTVITTQSFEEMVMSQGYKIELNDMHGKPKAMRVLNQGGSEISSTEYFYKVDDPNATEPQLNNTVKIIDPTGTVSDKVIGRDIEFFTDLREQETNNSGLAVNIGVDIVAAGFIIFPVPHWPVNGNNEYKLFRSACAVKVVETHGIIHKVTKSENGSSISTENIAYDGVTGDAVVTRTQNEFKKSYYSTNIPAYWVYEKMGGAYQNLGVLLKDITLNSYHEVNDPISSVLTQGDEIVNIANGTRYWIMERRRTGSGPFVDLFPKKLILDLQGKIMTSFPTGVYKIVRSGFRNLLGTSTSSIVSLNNPIKNNKLEMLSGAELGASLKVISTSVSLFDDEWPVNVTGEPGQKIENTSHVFRFIKAGNHAYHGDNNCRLFEPCGGESQTYCGNPFLFSNAYLKNRMDVIGAWLDTSIPGSLDEPVGFLTTFDAPESKYYYIGYAGDDRIKITIDGGAIVIPNTNNSLHYWQIQPLFLEAGPHTIEVEGYNENNGINTPASNPGSIAVEIYNTSIANLVGTTNGAGLNQIFQTSSVFNDPNLQSFRTINGVKVWHFTYSNFYNPFASGFKGNWRPSQSKIYQAGRSYDKIFDSGKKGINVKDAGFLETFRSYWAFDDLLNKLTAYNGNLWVRSNSVTLSDRDGQELENRDALNRYSAAKFDFGRELPSAVASNAMNREIFVNSFEDILYKQTHGTDTLDVKLKGSYPNLTYLLNSASAHSGNYSLKLSMGDVVLNTQIHSLQHKTEPYLFLDDGGYQLLNKPGLYPNGFEPMPNKRYIISAWVKDGQPNNRSINITVTIKGSTPAIVPVVLSCKAIVEGWKLLEGTINTGEIPGTVFQLRISGGGQNIDMDDLRIHPYDAHMKSYAYDEKNFRLMAELDENCFATFYEYDDEGSLVRVKKETERGIATIKENRSSYRKRL